MLNRRGLITGLISLCAAPAIVRAESLMKLAPTKLIKIECDIAGVKFRKLTEYVVTDSELGRLDILFFTLLPRPEWALPLK